jgi:hypothetical protein
MRHSSCLAAAWLVACLQLFSGHHPEMETRAAVGAPPTTDSISGSPLFPSTIQWMNQPVSHTSRTDDALAGPQLAQILIGDATGGSRQWVSVDLCQAAGPVLSLRGSPTCIRYCSTTVVRYVCDKNCIFFRIHSINGKCTARTSSRAPV